MALAWERLAKTANEGELTQARVIEYGNDLLKRVGQESVGKVSTQGFVKDWLLKGVKAPTTRKRYEAVTDSFLAFLGPKRSVASLGSVTTQEIEAFRDDEVAKGKTASTADFGLKVIRAMMESAKRSNVRLDNPADGVERMQVQQQERKPFTDIQLKQLLQRSDVEWKGMLLFGALAGLRLNDAANLRWNQIDLAQECLTFLPAKTARRKPNTITIALHPDIVDYLKARPVPEAESDPVFHTLHGRKSGSAGGLSNQFVRFLVEAGLRATPSESLKTCGASKGRQFFALGFHSTRHYFISKLANADVPAEVRKAMAGHTADKAHLKYVHLELATQKRAVQKIPSCLT